MVGFEGVGVSVPFFLFQGSEIQKGWSSWVGSILGGGL